MGSLSRWFNYAKARLDAAIGQGNRELDELEARREAELAEKPWLGSTGDAPTFEEAKARIEWEAEQAARAAEAGRGGSTPDAAAGGAPGGPGGSDGDAASRGPSGGAPGAADAVGATSPGAEPTSPEDRAAAAEAAAARLELERRQQESAARLDQIRAELGIEPPAES